MADIFVLEVQRYQVFSLPYYLKWDDDCDITVADKEALDELSDWERDEFDSFKEAADVTQPDADDPEYWELSNTKAVKWLCEHSACTETAYAFSYWEFDSLYSNEAAAESRGKSLSYYSFVIDFRVRRKKLYGS